MTRTYEPGTYRAHIVGWALGMSGNGNPQVAWTFVPDALVTADGELPVGEAHEQTMYRPFTDKTIDMITNELESMGYDRPGLDELDKTHPNWFDFEGKEIRVRLKYEEYNNREVPRWEFDLGRGMKPLVAGSLNRFSALYAQKKKHLSNGAGLPPRNAPPPAGAQRPGGEEIPF